MTNATEMASAANMLKKLAFLKADFMARLLRGFEWGRWMVTQERR
jgi:hypothetical protein